jgi:predicted PurR-regulated permease PerM
VLTVKPNFLALLCYAMTVFWLFLGYYDKMFITYLIIAFAMSLFFDIIYIILSLTGRINTTNPTSSGFVVLLIIFLILELAIRIIMIIKIMPFKIPSQKEEYFEIMGREVELKLRAGKRESLRY